MNNSSKLLNFVKRTNLIQQLGRLTSVQGIVIEATGCKVQVGELVKITHARTGKISHAEVVGLKESKFYLMPHGSVDGLCLESTVSALGDVFSVPVGNGLLGRVINSLGEPIDDIGPLDTHMTVPSHGENINPLARSPITEQLITGIRAIDTFIPIGKGQRLGIFAGSGVGKSTLLGMIAKYSNADVIVIALIGERGREVNDFIRNNLNKEGMKRSVLVIATAADPAVIRRQAAYTATSIAEWFRAQNKHVLLIMDSITRLVMAQREIAISIGEPMGTRGYPSSSLALLPPLIERAGSIFNKGSISAIYTVLVEGDDFNEPISDNMRSIVDGHIMLERSLVSRSQYPAIDVLSSISRLSKSILLKEKIAKINKLREVISRYEESREMIEMGLYVKGSNPMIDIAVELNEEIVSFLKQADDEYSDESFTWKKVDTIFSKIRV